MIGAGTFLNPLLKVVTTIAVLAAIYFFLVRPILDTTESISGQITNTVNRGLDQTEKAQKQAQQAEKQAQQQGAQSFEIQAGGLSLEQANRIQQCVENAGQDVDALQACGELANKLASH